MEVPNAKLQKAACLLLLFLLCSLAVARQGVPDCCRQKTCSCRIYDLLHGMGNHAAGILTLGKRKSGSQPFQSRLYRLLQGSGNHAAGILTMGRRAELVPDHPVLACRNASGCASGTDTQPTPAWGASDADPSGTRECMGQMGKDSTKSQDLVAAKIFY